MQRLQAYKYEILPNGDQQRRMRRFAGSCRFVFNKALALQKERYKRGEKKLSYAGLCQLLTQWRNGTETPWLADAPTHPLQQALKDLERAYQNFFAKRAHFPRFKRSRDSASAFATPTPSNSRSTRATAGSSCPSWAGFATATAGRYWAWRRASP